MNCSDTREVAAESITVRAADGYDVILRYASRTFDGQPVGVVAHSIGGFVVGLAPSNHSSHPGPLNAGARRSCDSPWDVPRSISGTRDEMRLAPRTRPSPPLPQS
jgi:hypothetical protein